MTMHNMLVFPYLIDKKNIAGSQLHAINKYDIHVSRTGIDLLNLTS